MSILKLVAGMMYRDMPLVLTAAFNPISPKTRVLIDRKKKLQDKVRSDKAKLKVLHTKYKASNKQSVRLKLKTSIAKLKAKIAPTAEKISVLTTAIRKAKGLGPKKHRVHTTRKHTIKKKVIDDVGKIETKPKRRNPFHSKLPFVTDPNAVSKKRDLEHAAIMDKAKKNLPADADAERSMANINYLHKKIQHHDDQAYDATVARKPDVVKYHENEIDKHEKALESAIEQHKKQFGHKSVKRVNNRGKISYEHKTSLRSDGTPTREGKKKTGINPKTGRQYGVSRALQRLLDDPFY